MRFLCRWLMHSLIISFDSLIISFDSAIISCDYSIISYDLVILLRPFCFSFRSSVFVMQKKH